MGGYGSGRWPSGKWDRKRTVEESQTLALDRFLQAGVFSPNTRVTGSYNWPDGASIGFQARTTEGEAKLKIGYTLSNTGERFEEWIDLMPSPQPNGGHRWWFACPGYRTLCHRLAGCLYSPGGGRAFACRQCHRLSYRARQETRPAKSVYAIMGTKGVKAFCRGYWASNACRQKEQHKIFVSHTVSIN